MDNIKIIVTASVAAGTDLKALQQRIADQLRQIANPVRDDQGITVVSNVLVTDGDSYQPRMANQYLGIRTGKMPLGIESQAHKSVMASESEMEE